MFFYLILTQQCNSHLQSKGTGEHEDQNCFELINTPFQRAILGVINEYTQPLNFNNTPLQQQYLLPPFQQQPSFQQPINQPQFQQPPPFQHPINQPQFQQQPPFQHPINQPQFQQPPPLQQQYPQSPLQQQPSFQQPINQPQFQQPPPLQQQYPQSPLQQQPPFQHPINQPQFQQPPPLQQQYPQSPLQQQPSFQHPINQPQFQQPPPLQQPLNQHQFQELPLNVPQVFRNSSGQYFDCRDANRPIDANECSFRKCPETQEPQIFVINNYHYLLCEKTNTFQLLCTTNPTIEPVTTFSTTSDYMAENCEECKNPFESTLNSIVKEVIDKMKRDGLMRSSQNDCEVPTQDSIRDVVTEYLASVEAEEFERFEMGGNELTDDELVEDIGDKNEEDDVLSVDYLNLKFNQNEINANGEELTANQKGLPVNQKQAPEKGKESNVNEKELTVNQKEAPVNQKQTPEKGKKLNVNEKELTVNQKEAPVNQKQTPEKGKKLNVNEKELKDNQKEAPVNQKQTPEKGKKLSVNEKELTVNQKETPEKGKVLPVADKSESSIELAKAKEKYEEQKKTTPPASKQKTYRDAVLKRVLATLEKDPLTNETQTKPPSNIGLQRPSDPTKEFSDIPKLEPVRISEVFYPKKSTTNQNICKTKDVKPPVSNFNSRKPPVNVKPGPVDYKKRTISSSSTGSAISFDEISVTSSKGSSASKKNNNKGNSFKGSVESGYFSCTSSSIEPREGNKKDTRQQKNPNLDFEKPTTTSKEKLNSDLSKKIPKSEIQPKTIKKEQPSNKDKLCKTQAANNSGNQDQNINLKNENKVQPVAPEISTKETCLTPTEPKEDSETSTSQVVKSESTNSVEKQNYKPKVKNNPNKNTTKPAVKNQEQPKKRTKKGKLTAEEQEIEDTCNFITSDTPSKPKILDIKSITLTIEEEEELQKDLFPTEEKFNIELEKRFQKHSKLSRDEMINIRYSLQNELQNKGMKMYCDRREEYLKEKMQNKSKKGKVK